MTERRPSAERKTEILEAALKIFIKKGYAEARMDDLVESLGLSKGALYHHFSSKRDLFIALIEHWMDQFAPINRPTEHSGKPSGDIIKAIARFTAKIFKRNPDWFLAEPEIWALANRDDEIRSLANQLFNRILSEFESLIKRGMEFGEFRPVNARMVSLSILTSLHGMIWFVLFQPDDFSPEDYVDLNMDFILNGIRTEENDRGH